MEKLSEQIAAIFAEGVLIEAAFNGPRKQGAEELVKVVVKPVPVRGERRYQFAYHAPRQVTHQNLTAEEATNKAQTLLEATFRQATFYTETADYRVLLNKRREASIKTLPASRTSFALTHDRKKNYLLPEDQPVDFLVRLGVMGETGKVIAAKYDKFRQINRFVEMVADVADALPPEGVLNVVDFGSGKSYLTFALYHYLRKVKGREVRIVGLDLKADVVAHCNALATDLNYAGLTFQAGAIRDFAGGARVDMVVSLHACDTATDDALAKAAQWGAKVILAVPCCQHELFKQLHNETLHPLLKHGLLKERMTALVTDSLRAQALEIAGYAVQLLEFIEMEHTPKNILIRAVRRSARPDTKKLRREYQEFRDFWHVQPYLEEVFGPLDDR